MDRSLQEVSRSLLYKDLLKDFAPAWFEVVQEPSHHDRWIDQRDGAPIRQLQKPTDVQNHSLVDKREEGWFLVEHGHWRRVVTMDQLPKCIAALLALPDIERIDRQLLLQLLPCDYAGILKGDLEKLFHAVKGDHFLLCGAPRVQLHESEHVLSKFDVIVKAAATARQRDLVNQSKAKVLEAIRLENIKLKEAELEKARYEAARLEQIRLETTSLETKKRSFSKENSADSYSEDSAVGVGDRSTCKRLRPTISATEDVYEQQCRIWNSSEQMMHLQKIWAAADKNSHLNYLGRQVAHIRAHGRPAKPYTKTTHGPTPFSLEEADYALFDEDEYIEWQKENHSRFSSLPVVVRDSSTIKYHPSESTTEWFTRMRKEPDTRIHVQRFTRTLDEASAWDYSIAELDEQWQKYSLDQMSDVNCPANCLNIQDSTPNMMPFGLAMPRFRMLTHACEVAKRMTPEFFKKLQINSDAVRISTVGKKVVREIPKAITLQSVDIENCEHFLIMAQAGSVSGWHIDQCGVFTYIRVLPKTPSQTNDEDVIKLWPLINFHNLSAIETDSIRAGFARDGDGWNPTPSNGIAGLALFTHDTLIQPPGTIHAPITLTECSARGGMVMDYHSLKETLKVWRWLADHDNCSNEELPKQTYVILKIIMRLTESEYDKYGITAEEKVQLLADCRYIASKAIWCGCSIAGCKVNCKCRSLQVPCGLKCKCHRKAGNTCDNTDKM